MNMIERIARAICAEEQGGPLGYFADGSPMRDGGIWNEYSERQHNEWRRVATAAIQAMREPTKQMMDAAQLDPQDDPIVSRGMAYSAWVSMIDAAAIDTGAGEG